MNDSIFANKSLKQSRITDENLEWLGDNIPDFAGNKSEKSANKKLLFPRVRQELPPNPTERDKFIERVHLDLDLDTARKMLFLKDQCGSNAYSIANGALQYNLSNNNSITCHFVKEDGGNLAESRRAAEDVGFLPIKKWEQMPGGESEKDMLNHVVQKNLLASANYLSKMAKSPDEEKRTKAAELMNDLSESLAKNDFDLSGRNIYDIKAKLLSSNTNNSFGGKFYNQDGGFFHITSPFGRAEKIECRLYLCPKNVYDMVDAIIGGHHGANAPKYCMKYDNIARNDRLVIYTDFAHAEKELEILGNLKDDRPELFENMGKNPLWGSIDGAPDGVYFGEEPTKWAGYYDDDETGKRTYFQTSYGGVRGEAFDDAYERWLSEYGMRSEIKTDDAWERKRIINFSSPNDITDAMVYHFADFFKQELSKHDIDPNNPCVNKRSAVENKDMDMY